MPLLLLLLDYVSHTVEKREYGDGHISVALISA
jgi:hypothetical protein